MLAASENEVRRTTPLNPVLADSEEEARKVPPTEEGETLNRQKLKGMLIKYIFSYNITIYHDPSGLLGAGTGATIWDSSLCLGKFLEKALNTYSNERLTDISKRKELNIIELGAGTGLLGLMNAFSFPNAKLTLTDQESVLPLLRLNVDESSVSSRIQVCELEFGNKDQAAKVLKERGPFDLIIMSDLITWPVLYSSIISSLNELSSKDTFILFSHESRDFEKEAKFYAKLSANGFAFKNVDVADQDEEYCSEDIFLFQCWKKDHSHLEI